MQNPISTQIELSNTVSSSVGALSNLIRAVSVDNVQPFAILAAERLGSRILFTDQLYSQAIRALNGNQSICWQNLKTVVGLSNGGTIKVIRESSALLGFFLLVCAWKPCFTDSDLGDLAFNMIAECGILKDFPIASFQLCDLIRTFSGHCEALSPAELMHQLAVEIDNHAPQHFGLYRLMGISTLSKILVEIFQLLQDESTVAITLSGHISGIWLATCFCFIFPEGTVVTVDGKTVKGSEKGARLHLELHNPSVYTSNDWTIKNWRRETVTEVVVSENIEFSDQCSYIPLKLTKAYFAQLYLHFSENPSRRSAISAIGEIAGALIVCLSEFGQIYQSESCCESAITKCKRVALLEIFPDEWVKSYNSILTQYGWDGCNSITSNQERLVGILRTVIGTQKDLVQGSTVWEQIESRIGKFLEERLGREFGDDPYDEYQPDTFISPASYIAVDAVLTAVGHIDSGTRRIAPLSKQSSNFANNCITSLLSLNGMEISEYRKRSLNQLLPGNPSFEDLDLIISSNGYVAGLNSLWDLDIRKSKVLAIRIIKGVIKRDEISYKSVREEKSSSAQRFREDSPEYLQIFRGGEYVGIQPRCEDEELKVQMDIAMVGMRLHLRSYFTLHGKYLCQLSWTDSILGLAFAKHTNDQSGLTLRQENELARRYGKDLCQAYWQSCHLWGPEDSEDKTVLKTFGNKELRFFSSGLLFRQRQMVIRETCFTLIVQYSGFLLASMVDGENAGGPWAIIC